MAQARSRELFSKYLFTVHDLSRGFTTSKFKTATGLEMTVGVAEYAEGGAMCKMKEPGMVTFANIILSRGVNRDRSFHDYCKEVADLSRNVPEGAGKVTPDLFREFDIRQKDRSQRNRISYLVHSAFPVKYKAAEFDNMTDEVQVEELELAQESFEIRLL